MSWQDEALVHAKDQNPKEAVGKLAAKIVDYLGILLIQQQNNGHILNHQAIKHLYWVVNGYGGLLTAGA